MFRDAAGHQENRRADRHDSYGAVLLRGLEAAKGPVELLVIDHIEKPSAN